MSSTVPEAEVAWAEQARDELRAVARRLLREWNARIEAAEAAEGRGSQAVKCDDCVRQWGCDGCDHPTARPISGREERCPLY